MCQLDKRPLTDPDGRLSGLGWAWESSPNRSNWSMIDGATAATYTPMTADEGRYLRVTASYGDGEGSGKSASWTAADRVQAAPVTMNHAPEFPSSESGQRSVLENTGAGVSIGAPVRADDADNDPLTYSLDRSGAAVFAIDERTGQLRTKAALDREQRSSYRITVTATDPSLASDSIAVTITLDDIDEDPELSGASVVSFAEGGSGSVARYSARDPERATITWSLAGVDNSLFSIDNGDLRFLTAPDYEAPADAGSDNAYEVTVTAADPAGHSDFIAVIVRVTETDETAGPARPPSGGGGGGGGGPSGPTPSDVDFEWNVIRDMEALDPDHDSPAGLWSDGVTLWIVESGPGIDDAVYAYALASGERQANREFALDERNRAPRGLWSDLETIWVSDSGRDTLFAYTLATGERVADRDVALVERNGHARGIWGDRETNTMWVLDGGEDALFAYHLGSGELLAEYALHSANDDPRGIWSDGVTIWVSDPSASPRSLFAYRLPVRESGEAGADIETLVRVREEDFSQLSRAGNNSPRGLWSDGDVIYVADANDDKVYSYNMPDAIDARLAALTLSGVDIGAFAPRTTAYAGVPGDGVTATTIKAEAVQGRATVGIVPAAAAESADGHQVTLADVREITITVTSPDGSRMRVYRVRIGETPQMAGPPGLITLTLREGGDFVAVPAGAATTAADLFEGTDVTTVWQYNRATRAWDRSYRPGPGLGGFPIAGGDVLWAVAPRSQTLPVAGTPVSASDPGPITLTLREGGDFVAVPAGAATTAADLFGGTDVTTVWQYNHTTRAWDRSYYPGPGLGGFAIAGGDVLWVVASRPQAITAARPPP